MLAIFESILPVFLLLVVGVVIRRLPLIDRGAWAGLAQLGYWFLYPALLFVTILNADFAGLSFDMMIIALLGTVALMAAFTLALWPMLKRSGLVAETEYSSIFQTAIRWNGFIALAVAQRIFPPAGMAVVALAMAVIIIPINIVSVYVVTIFADRSANWPRIARGMVTNPLIIACTTAALLRALPFQLYGPVNEALGLIGQAAIGMALITIGAELRVAELLRPRLAAVLSLAIKLALFPAAMIAVGLALGIGGIQLSYLVLCASVPTATNGYLLARQLGGDAELYATITTQQTVAAFLTMPAALAAAAYIAG